MNSKLSLVTGFSLIIMAFFVVARSSHVLASWLIDKSGSLVQVDPAVLGDNSEVTEEDMREGDDEVESEDGDTSTTEKQDKNSEKKLELLKKRQEQEKKTQEVILENKKKELKRQSEARKKQLELNKQIRKTEITPTERKLELKQEVRDQDGKVLKEEKRELPDNEPLHVEQEDGQQLKIKALENEELELEGERVRTRTNFPLTIGENNTLIITKKDGTQKTVTQLPDQALANLETKGFLATQAETELAENEQGEPVYKFKAEKEKKIFGLFRRRFTESVEVSAETGEVVSTADENSSGLERLLARFAF